MEDYINSRIDALIQDEIIRIENHKPLTDENTA